MVWQIIKFQVELKCVSDRLDVGITKREYQPQISKWNLNIVTCLLDPDTVNICVCLYVCVTF